MLLNLLLGTKNLLQPLLLMIERRGAKDARQTEGKPVASRGCSLLYIRN